MHLFSSSGCRSQSRDFIFWVHFRLHDRRYITLWKQADIATLRYSKENMSSQQRVHFSFWMNFNPINHHYSTEKDNVKVGFIQDGLSKRIKIVILQHEHAFFSYSCWFPVSGFTRRTHSRIFPSCDLLNRCIKDSSVNSVTCCHTLLHFVKNTKTQSWKVHCSRLTYSVKNRAGCISFLVLQCLKM